jgi:pimeloyl-ACP methyl ester carboxylesterase
VSVFGLVHGAWHGGWCWERLVPELEQRGHTAVLPDLPCEDVRADATEYARVVGEALGDADGDVVLVGHSLGGSPSRSWPPPGRCAGSCTCAG